MCAFFCVAIFRLFISLHFRCIYFSSVVIAVAFCFFPFFRLNAKIVTVGHVLIVVLRFTNGEQKKKRFIIVITHIFTVIGIIIIVFFLLAAVDRAQWLFIYIQTILFSFVFLVFEQFLFCC